MSSWTHGAQANKMSHFSTTRTLSDFPLLIGEMLRRGNLLSFFLVSMSLVPFVCVALPEEWRLSVFTSGIVSGVFAGVIFYFAHSRWQARRRDYCLWLRLIYRRVSDL
jgi:hypothetical protein